MIIFDYIIQGNLRSEKVILVVSIFFLRFNLNNSASNNGNKFPLKVIEHVVHENRTLWPSHPFLILLEGLLIHAPRRSALLGSFQDSV